MPRTATGRRRLLTLVLAVVLLVLLLPYLWLILTSLKNRNDIFSGNVFSAFAPTLDNFRVAFLQKGFTRNLLNSAVVATTAMSIAMAVGVPAGYALSRNVTRSSTVLLFVMLAARLMPVVVLAVPLFVIMANLGLVGTYAGLRPLIAPSDGSTVRASREHRVVIEPTGLVRVSGGKYTTYRQMAEETVDAAVGVLGERVLDRPSRTATRRLIGAADRAELDELVTSLTTSSGLDRAVIDRLVARHGTEAADVLALGHERGLLGHLADGEEHLEAEVAWAARHELALSIDDVLSRRTRLVQEMPDRGASIAPAVAAILGAELGWDAARQATEVRSFIDGARAEFSVA